MHAAGIETTELDKIDFCNKIMFVNSLYFVAFFSEVINKAITAKQNDKPIDIFTRIAESAGKKGNFHRRLSIQILLNNNGDFNPYVKQNVKLPISAIKYFTIKK